MRKVLLIISVGVISLLGVSALPAGAAAKHHSTTTHHKAKVPQLSGCIAAFVNIAALLNNEKAFTTALTTSLVPMIGQALTAGEQAATTGDSSGVTNIETQITGFDSQIQTLTMQKNTLQAKLLANENKCLGQ